LNVIRKLAAFALAAGLLAACTATFTYNQLDWLIPWYVDGYVDLNRDQRRLLRQQLEPQLQWHRGEELAAYVDLLNRIESDLAKPPTADVVNGWIEAVVAALERVERSLLEVALEFGSSVSDAQMEEFIGSLWENQREYEEEYLSRSDEEYRRDNYENLEDLLDRLLGRLSDEQEEILESAAGDLRRFDSVWLEERAAWLRTLEPLLQRNDGWQAAVEESYRNREQSRTPEYRAILDGNTAVVSSAVAEVLTTMSGEQHAHARQEIEDLRRKLRKLIRQQPEAD
jgi:hypothetical protein